jgi:hypothetical protein
VYVCTRTQTTAIICSAWKFSVVITMLIQTILWCGLFYSACKRTKGQIMIYKTPNRKLQIEQYEPHYNSGWIQELRRVSSTRYISGTCTSCFMINDIMRKRHQKSWVLSFLFVSRTNLLSIINLPSWVFCSIFDVRCNIYDRRPVSNRRPLLKSASTDVIISNHCPILGYSQISVLSKLSYLYVRLHDQSFAIKNNCNDSFSNRGRI